MESRGRRALRAPATNATPPEVGINPEIPIETVQRIEEQIQHKAPVAMTASAVGAIAPLSEEGESKSTLPSHFSDLMADLGRQNFAAFVDSQTAFARGIETLSAEIAGLALSGVEAAARTATDALSVKTIADAIEVNAGFTCRSFDALVVGSAKLSEASVKLATETLHPLMTHFGNGWTKAARLALGQA
jgi:hypothetical protein